MTLDQFMAKLRKTPRRWYMDNGTIRLQIGSHSQCPLLVVDGDLTASNLAYRDAAHHLGIGLELGRAIACAADESGDYEHDLRMRLLRACGLLTPRRTPTPRRRKP